MTLVLDDSGGPTAAWSDLAAEAFELSVGLASPLIPLEDVQVTFRCDPEATIPEWGVGGETIDAYHVDVAMDPPSLQGTEGIIRTLLHEFHHAIRWRSMSLELDDLDLRGMLASEGLAVLFEEEAFGTAPFFVNPDPAASDVALALQSLDERPCNRSEWFFGAGRVPPAFGWALGYRLCRDYANSAHTSASALTATPAVEIIAT
jgi:Predicted Zn-dependent protease (DUF2268)